MDNQSLRLNKFLAERLGVSRREADELIAAGKITINGKTAITGIKVDKNDIVCYNKKIVPFQTEFLYLALHKPVGYVCSRHAQGSTPTIYKLLPQKYHKLKTVGRLDKDSSGLILLTNDGDFAFKMTHPKFRKTKIYEVELDKLLQPIHQQMISDFGVMLDDGLSQFKVLKITSAGDGPGGGPPLSNSEVGEEKVRQGPPKEYYTVLLTEGRNRQIRRTFAALDYKVTKLHRTHFGKYELGDLKPGKYVIIEP